MPETFVLEALQLAEKHFKIARKLDKEDFKIDEVKLPRTTTKTVAIFSETCSTKTSPKPTVVIVMAVM